MQSNNHLARVMEERELAYFRAELALFSPESYSLQEKAEICKGMTIADAEACKVMREDFQRLSPNHKAVLFKMLLEKGDLSERYWRYSLNYWD